MTKLFEAKNYSVHEPKNNLKSSIQLTSTRRSYPCGIPISASTIREKVFFTFREPNVEIKRLDQLVYIPINTKVTFQNITDYLRASWPQTTGKRLASVVASLGRVTLALGVEWSAGSSFEWRGGGGGGVDAKRWGCDAFKSRKR